MTLAEHAPLAVEVAALNCMDVLLRIVEDYDVRFGLLAADLMHGLCRYRVNCGELLAASGVGKVSESGRGREKGYGGLTREVETPLTSNSPRDHMILRVDLVGSHGRWKRPYLQTAHMTI